MSRLRAVVAAFLLALAAAVTVAAAENGAPVELRGIVRGPRGEPVAGALVRLISDLGTSRVETAGDGRFAFALEHPLPRPALLRVTAPGFENSRRALTSADRGKEIVIDLAPSRFSEQVNVTASRSPRTVGDTPASVVVLGLEDLSMTAAPAVDDALRQATGFALFRRSGSRTANPTTQGVSLRGVGASGAARAAVLSDGLALNDPFGGWIFWGRVAMGSLDRAEIVRGGASQLYGSSALAGVVQLVRRPAAAVPGVEADLSAGTESTRDAALFASARSGDFSSTVSAESFSTGGYVPVAPEERGPVDAPATSRHDGANLTAERHGARSRVFLRGDLYEESRGNGTPLQKNDVHFGEASAGAEWQAGPASVALRASGTGETFHQSFTSIASDRSSERLIRLQTVPADAEGISAQFSIPFGAHGVVAGVEAHRTAGESREEIPGGIASASSFTTAGGRQMAEAAFVEDVWTAGADWTLTAGARFDAWGNRDGRTVQETSGTVTTVLFPDRDESAWSPRLSGLFRASGDVTLSGSAYGSFRAPTLNELYRSFRVGNTVTQANSDLRAERLQGAEAGVALEPRASRWRARLNFFWMEVRDAIGNRTLSSTPTLITRRRENIGRTRARGAELDLDARLGSWTIGAGYLFSDSTVVDAPAGSGLEGLRVPQVPRSQATLRLAWRPASWSLGVQARTGGAQFEDDQNLLRLRPYASLDVFLSRAIGAFEPYFALENASNARIEAGRTPSTTLAAPRTARVGLRVRLGG